MKLFNLIVKSADVKLFDQLDNGSFDAGHNGPYKDPETPVRNTAHWCLTFIKAYEISEDDKYFSAAVKCGDYLLSKEARPMNGAFFCRKNPEKDFANGLVGQAWTIEALVKLTEVTGEQKYKELATKVFLFHPYDQKNKAWIRLNVDGSYNGFDRTFNHQLWFAAAGGLLSDSNKVIKEQIVSFLAKMDDHLDLYPDGCIKHKGKFLVRGKKQKIRSILKNLAKSKHENSYIRMKSVGYHGFNLYAFAMLKNSFPDHSFFSSDMLKSALNYACSDSFKEMLPESKYGFPYNPPGFEMAFALQEFDTAPEEEISEWVSWQIKKCYNFESNLMTEGNTKDANTYAARIYEATRLRNYELKVD